MASWSWRTGRKIKCPHRPSVSAPVAVLGVRAIGTRGPRVRRVANGRHARVGVRRRRRGRAARGRPALPVPFNWRRCCCPFVNTKKNYPPPVPWQTRAKAEVRPNQPTTGGRSRVHFVLMAIYKCNSGVVFLLARVRTRLRASPSHSELRA